MTLDPELCFRALAGRDPRFDGRFFTAVVSTGIYCRSICPAVPPRRENVRFYPCAAAAETAGFRPCRRCRPEASPGTPAWLGTSATVDRALHLVAGGALDRMSVGSLASRLGVGDRHLRRLFEEHLGATPLQVALTRRLHFARRLLDETILPVSEVAEVAGFGSVRRFNAAFRRAFRASPSELRQRPRGRGRDDSRLDLRLSYREPLDWEGLLAFLAARAIPGVEQVAGGIYRRTARAAGETGVIEVSAGSGGGHLRLTIPIVMAPAAMAVVARVRRLFDLDADPAVIAAELGRDPALAPAFRRRPGLRVPGSWDPFELGVRAILGQQVSVAAATTLAGRIAREYGEVLTGGERERGGLGYLFPVPDRLAKAPLEELGLTTARAEAVRGFARRVSEGEIELDAGRGLDDLILRLSRLPGVGPWTAQYIALRGLGEPDAFPAGDLWLRRALAPVAGARLSERELLERARGWRPWRAYAAIALWSDPPAASDARALRDV